MFAASTMSTEVVLVVAQARVAVPLAAIEVGVAVKLVTAGESEITVMVTDAGVAFPPSPLADAVKVVVALTTTVWLPESPRPVWSSPKMLGVITTVEALVLAQVRVTVSPTWTDVLSAVRVTVGGTGVVAVIVTEAVAVPPSPVAVMV